MVVGGFAYARFIVVPSLQLLPDDVRAMLIRAQCRRLKPIAFTSILALFLTGSYNLYHILDRSIVDTSYHLVFGVKFLLAFHVFAMLLILSTPPSNDAARTARRPRLMLGTIISGLIIFALGAYLRTLHN